MNKIVEKPKKLTFGEMLEKQAGETYENNMPPFIKVVIKNLEYFQKTSPTFQKYRESFRTNAGVIALKTIIIGEGLLGLIPDRDYSIIPLNNNPKLVRTAAG